MISPMFSHLLIPFIVGMFLAMNMGGSGTSPSFSVAYGSNIIRRFAIPGLFGIFVFIGAIIAGKKTALTMGKGIMPADEITLTIATIVLISIAISLLLANLIGVPQSTSQSAVFALSGPALYFNMFNSHKVFYEIIPVWFVLPVISFVLMYFIGKYLYPLLRRVAVIKFADVTNHPVLRMLVIISACYVSFAIGSNNVANASGPIASMVINELNINPDLEDKFVLIMILSTLIIAPCFAIGSSIFGRKIMETTGKGIVDIGPLEATIISIVTASLLLLASITKGIPTSLVQLNTLAIIGLGISKMGWKKIIVNKTIRKFWIVWLAAPILSLILSFSLCYLADNLGILYY
ncbi:MAG: anion permease, partial [Bacteroidales bacterium]|nr:anion permease [Bacteroidales bacterium]